MKIIRLPLPMQRTALKLRQAGKSIGLVPTMGALHQGHRSLIRRARRENDIVIVSVFVNPTQFGPNEDYARYPRPFERDRAACAAEGVDYLFAPRPQEIYPEGSATWVEVEGLSNRLCGASRPGHFRGVTTVVAKLFNIAQPVRAYFGEKDFQQVAVIRRMVADLVMPVAIVPCPIVREASGLALSSRNQYLSVVERAESAKIHRALQEARDLIQSKKVKTSRKIIEKVTSRLSSIPGHSIDYVSVLDPETLEPVSSVKLPLVIAVAVRVGKTRLIDNTVVKQLRR